MFYHAKLEFAGDKQYWTNRDKDKIIKELLIPFINGQVTVIKRDDQRRVLNMKNVTLLTIYKTPERLNLPIKSYGRVSNAVLKSLEENVCTDEIINEVRSDQGVLPSHSILQMAFAPPKNQVFVIMKFGNKELDSAYEGVIKPVIEHYEYQCIRIDEIQDSGKITDQVLEYIATSKYILADLSGERPNCYYEAGFAHALGKQLIFTIRKADIIHFDLAGYRFIQWDTEAELRRELNKRFESLKQESQD
jgi:hypothetical protein